MPDEVVSLARALCEWVGGQTWYVLRISALSSLHKLVLPAVVWLGAVACSSKEVLWPGTESPGFGGNAQVGPQASAAGGAGPSLAIPPACVRTIPVGQPLSPPTDVEAAIRLGLSAWRKPMEAGSCAGCHGPDAIDLARIGYSDGDILERAMSQRLAAAEAQAILDMVHALRSRYGITLLCQPSAPLFQPGGQRLSGASNEDRDFAFLDELRRHGVDLAQGVSSFDAANALVANLRSIDPLTLSVGFSMSFWSAAPTLTGERATQFQWLPDRAAEPLAGQESAWYALADAYLANPTDAALWALYTNVGTMTHPSPALAEMEQSFADYQAAKFRAVLVGSHMLRGGQLSYPNRVADLPVDDSSNLRFQRSPLWDLANFSGTYDGAHALSGTPADVVLKYGYQSDDEVSGDVRRFVAPHGWLAVGFDPARQFSGERGNGNIGLIVGGFLESTAGSPQLILHRRTFEILLELFRVERQDQRYGSMAHKPPVPNGQWASAEITRAPADDLPTGTTDYTANQLAAYRQINLIWFRTVLEMVRKDLEQRHLYNQGTLDTLVGLRDYLTTYGSPDQVAPVQQLYAAITELAKASTPE